MPLKRFLFLLVIPLLFSSFFSEPEVIPVRYTKLVPDDFKNFCMDFYPAKKEGDQIIKHHAFALCYEEKFEQAKWVAYRLTDQMCLKKEQERTDNFREDKDVKTASATPDDYKKSGYDRGHLCPAGDMGWSDISMNESFLMSNMSPQAPQFNRGIWKTLETDVRNWAKEFGELYIVTAGVLKDTTNYIGKNNVVVPDYFYKVVLDVHSPQYKAIAFIMPNTGSKLSVFNYAVSIDSLERLTAIDFFPALPDSLENNLESHLSVELWK